MTHIRLAERRDATRLPAIERSAGQSYRQIPDLSWIADGDDQSVERHLELIALGTNWVVVDHPDSPIGFLSAEVLGDSLHVWEVAVRQDRQGGRARGGHGVLR
ncbi:MAG: hypothetical protein ABJE47_18510 [bacterium]